MKFSVLIPVYNTEKYLEECLQSVLSQTYQDFEIIIVDDGSTDSSGEICDSYHKKYPSKIKVIHKENQGLISARRVGIANATGDYCIFVDSDDYIEKELLSELDRILTQDETIDLLLYSFKYVQDGKVVKQFSRIALDGTIWDDSNRNDIIEKLLFSNDVTPIWIKAVKTTLLKSDPTDYSLFFKKNMGEDTLQSLYLLTTAQKIMYCYLPLYCYNYNNTSISRSFSPDTIQKKNMIHVYRLIEKWYLPIWKMNDDKTTNRLFAMNFNGCMYLFFNHYENAKNKKDVLDFNWSSFLLNNKVECYSAFIDKTYYRIYRFWQNNSVIRLRLFFVKRKIYKTYKNNPIKKWLREK